MAAYAGLLALVCIALVLVVGDGGRIVLSDAPGILVLVIMLVVSVATRDRAGSGVSNSYSTVILLACLPLYGPTVAAFLGIAAALAERPSGLSIVAWVNGLMMSTMALTGGIVFLLLGGTHPAPSGLTSGELVRVVGLPLMAAGLVMCVVNVLVLVGIVRITGGSPRALLAGSVRELVPLYAGYAPMAFVFVLLWGPADVGPLSAVLIAAPLAIAHFVYIQYGDEVRAHERIVGMFARAGDGPDGRVAAHGARVDELCQLMAGQLGLNEHERRTLSYAAVLHDIAMKSVVRATDVQRGGTGPYTNVQALLPHPELAERVVSGIPFLQEAARTIRSHHERMDGRGYPDGLIGEQIPLPARILAVADAFDALTTSRGEREALDTHGALAELQLSAGSHLDPRALEALTVALRGRERPGHNDPLHEGSWLWDHHTLPAMSDVIADELAPGRAPDDGRRARSAAAGSTRTAPGGGLDDPAVEHGSRLGAARPARARPARAPQERQGGPR